jgi:TFIIF-interacting CTD phosphatase-like protein
MSTDSGQEYTDADDNKHNQCIVLDLDETLLCTFDDMVDLYNLGILTDSKLLDIRRRTYYMRLDDVVDKKGTGVKSDLWGITRPHLDEFLRFCFDNFKIVAVWSAGRKKYVHAVVDWIFKNVGRPHIIYTYDDCEKTSGGLLIKPLQRMIDQINNLEKYMSLSNVFVIDDRRSTFESSNPDNGIVIPEYLPHPDIKEMRADDTALLQLINFFQSEDVKNSTDVRQLNKKTIFTTDV